MKAHLLKNIKPRILNGHPWIYDNEIESIEGAPENGAFISVYHNGNFIGKGYFNSNSLIRIRLVSRRDVEIDKSFWESKIKKAVHYRKRFYSPTDSFRIIFGEADGIPGFIADKFSDYISIQVNTLGIYKIKELLVELLIKEFSPEAIFEKDDDMAAKKEGFEPVDGWIYKKGPELIPFKLNGLTFFADTLGQKTGFFLDQRDNARLNAKYCKGMTVVDAFTYTGNFGIHALMGNAKHVTFMDYSERALFVLKEALSANKFRSERYDIINGNSFDILRKFDSEGRKFDFTIIDPPSMTKARDSKENAFKGYKEINLRAMKLTNDGGYLSTSSCTQLIYDNEFRKVITDAAEDTKKQLTVIHKGMMGPDHPNVANILETEYLKHYLFCVDSIKNY